MIKQISISYIVVLLCTPFAVAQHADIQFSYDADIIVLRDGIPGNTDGFQIFEGTFPVRGFSERFTENPGFLSEIANMDMVLPGDEIELEILESGTFGSYLTFYDPVTGGLNSTDATLSIEDNMGTNTTDLDITNLSITGDNPQFIQTASGSGEIHSHIDFFLSAEAEIGAYGILFRLKSNNAMIEDSQPVWLVFNYGMSPFEFDEFAIPAFVGSDVLIGDVNGDGVVNLLDVAPFVDLVSSGGFSVAADINGDGIVNLLDVAPFVAILSGG